MKQAIAILDATGENGKVIAKALAGGNRLLLFGHDAERLDRLAAEVKELVPQADFDTPGCAFEASWEADIIIMDSINEKELADKIREVATQKLVIELTKDTSNNTLQTLLPNSKVRQVNTANASRMMQDILEMLEPCKEEQRRKSEERRVK